MTLTLKSSTKLFGMPISLEFPLMLVQLTKMIINLILLIFLFNVGVFYQDDDQFDVAKEYYERAAAQSHAGAQYDLVMLNEDNQEQMLRYLGQAAAQDHPEAL
jgi:hypothetical protein